jgi:hypothetical protein
LFPWIFRVRHTHSFCCLLVLIRCHSLSQIFKFLWTAFAFHMISTKPNLLYGKWRILVFKTQLFRISYLNLEMTISSGRHTPLLPVYHLKNGDTLILAHCIYDQAIIYKQRENRVDRIRNSNGVSLFSYIESLVSPHWK